MLLNSNQIRDYCIATETELSRLEKTLIKHEGLSTEYYHCNSVLHFGIGHNCEVNRLTEAQKDIVCSGKLKHRIELAFDLFEQDIKEADNGLYYAFRGLIKLSTARKSALIQMIFQMGRGSFLEFKETIKLIALGKWEMAALEAADSVWFREDPKRAKEVLLGFLV